MHDMTRVFGCYFNMEGNHMTKKILYIVCGVTLILSGIFIFSIIPEYEYITTSLLSLTPPPVYPYVIQLIISVLHFLRICETYHYYPLIIVWLYHLTVPFYIVFGLYVIYISFTPKYKITIAISSIMAALGLGSAVATLYHFIKYGISNVYLIYAPAPLTDSFTRFIQSITPDTFAIRVFPISCAMFVHILLVIFILINLVLLIRGKPKKRKTKYWIAGTLGGILLILTILSRLYIYSSLSYSYFFGSVFDDLHTVPYLLISMLFSLATSYGLFRILSVSVLRTKAKNASDRQD